MKILLTKTLPTEDGLYYFKQFHDAIPQIVVCERDQYTGKINADINNFCWAADHHGGYWAKVDQSMFQLCESEQERREIIQKQHSNDTHRAVDIDRPEPECKCKDCNLIKMDSDKNKNKSMCLNCFNWSKKDA